MSKPTDSEKRWLDLVIGIVRSWQYAGWPHFQRAAGCSDGMRVWVCDEGGELRELHFAVRNCWGPITRGFLANELTRRLAAERKAKGEGK